MEATSGSRLRLGAVLLPTCAALSVLLTSCGATSNEAAPDSPAAAPADTPPAKTITGFDLPQVVAASPDGAMLYVAQNDGTVVKINTPAYTRDGSWNSGITVPLGIAISPDGATLYMSNRTAGTVVRKNAATGAGIGSWSTGSGTSPTGIGLSPDGATIYVPQNASAGLGADKLTVRTASDGTLLQTWTLPKGSRPRSVVISPDGSKAYASMEGVNSISVRKTSDGSEIDSWRLKDTDFSTPGYLALSKRGDLLYVGAVSPSGVLVLKTADGSTAGDWNKNFKSAFGVAAANCGQTIFVADWTTPGNVQAVEQPNQCMADVPSAPQSVKAAIEGKKRVITVAWRAPENDGGSPITSYTATATDTTEKQTTAYTCITKDGTTLTCPIEVKVGNRQYEVTVTATNAFGTGPPASPPVQVAVK